jgi:mannose-1-phosphate guanylyltransferase
VEPVGKDTAPAVTWATLEVIKRYGKEVAIGFFPADHYIGDQEAYINTLKAAVEVAVSQKAIVTLGIKPDYPSTGYGYIEQGENQGEFNGLPVYKVSRFTEKPDRTTAEKFLETGLFSWNSGMFIFQGQVVLEELKTHANNILQPLSDRGIAAYEDLEKKSIDYALMEKTQLAYVLPANFGWDDLGDWNSLERLLEAKGKNIELANHVGLDTEGSIIYASDEEEVIVTIGLKDMVIVRDGKATLVVHKDRTQDIKQVLKQLQTDPKLEKLL